MTTNVIPKQLNIEYVIEDDYYSFIKQPICTDKYLLLKELSTTQFEVLLYTGEHKIIDIKDYKNKTVTNVIVNNNVETTLKHSMLVDSLREYSKMRQKMINIENLVEYLKH